MPLHLALVLSTILICSQETHLHYCTGLMNADMSNILQDSLEDRKDSVTSSDALPGRARESANYTPSSLESCLEPRLERCIDLFLGLRLFLRTQQSLSRDMSLSLSRCSSGRSQPMPTCQSSEPPLSGSWTGSILFSHAMRSWTISGYRRTTEPTWSGSSRSPGKHILCSGSAFM